MLKKFMGLDQPDKRANAQVENNWIKLQHNKWIHRVQKSSKCLICYEFFCKSVNLRNMLTQFMKMMFHITVGFVIKVFSYVRFKRHVGKVH